MPHPGLPYAFMPRRPRRESLSYRIRLIVERRRLAISEWILARQATSTTSINSTDRSTRTWQ